MPEPTPNQLGWADNRLTNVALDFAAAQVAAGNYIAGDVFPITPVDLPTGKYPVFERAYFLRDEVAVRPLGGPPRKVTYRMSSDSYSCDEEALQADIDPRERASWSGPNSMAPEEAKVRQLQLQHLIHRDARWASKYMATGVWGQDLTGVASSPSTNQFLQWDNDNSDPVDLIDGATDIVTGKVGPTWRPNTLVLGVDAARKLRHHAGLLALLAVNDLRSLDNAGLARLFRLDKVLVAAGIKNTGPEKETLAATKSAAVYSRIVGPKDALLVYSSGSGQSTEPSGGRTFAWTGLLGAQAFDPTAAAFRGTYTDGSRTDWVQVAVAYDFKVVAPELGVYFSGAVA